MNARTYLLSSLFTLTTLICIAQNELMVVAKSGLFIRDSTTINAKSVCSVKFGEMVEILERTTPKVTLNGMKGRWTKIKYNTCTGYVFDAYLGSFQKRDKKFPKNYPQYLDLEPSCGEEQYFNSDFYWYGIFEKGDEFDVSIVNLEFSVKSENWQDELYDQYLKVTISNTQKPLFLIGLPDSIPNYKFQKSEFAGANHIYPGQHFDVSSTSFKKGVSYSLASYGNVVDWDGKDSARYSIPYFMGIKDYKIKIIEAKDGKTRGTNLLQDFEKPVTSEDLPYITFVGDLNYDSVPDILISHQTGHASANIYLFMSGYTKSEILTKVALNRWGACY